MDLFICNLHRQIEQLHQQKYGDDSVAGTFTVDRGQNSKKKDFEELVRSKGGLIAFNNVLPTSKKKKTFVFSFCVNKEEQQ